MLPGKLEEMLVVSYPLGFELKFSKGNWMLALALFMMKNA